MITNAQENQIDVYLKSKKLYSPLHHEVKDHFISQIYHLMEEQSLSFQEAFLATKVSWKNELEMVKADIFSFKKVARIEKIILQQKFHKMTVFSFIFSAVAFVFRMLNEEAFTTLQILLLLSWVSVLGYSFITGKMKFSNYAMLSFHPLLIRNILLGTSVFFLAGIMKFGYLEIQNLVISKIFLVYCLTIQLQLMYFNAKKINVLI